KVASVSNSQLNLVGGAGKLGESSWRGSSAASASGMGFSARTSNHAAKASRATQLPEYSFLVIVTVHILRLRSSWFCRFGRGRRARRRTQNSSGKLSWEIVALYFGAIDAAAKVETSPNIGRLQAERPDNKRRQILESL